MVNKPYSNPHSWGNELQKRFKYNYLQNTLSYQLINEGLNDIWYQVSEEQQFTGSFGSFGFSLDSGWMTFTVRTNKIRVFYKQIQASSRLNGFWKPQNAIYFRKGLPKECPVIFEFTSADEVEKVGNSWVKKNKVLSETKGGSNE